MTIPNEYMAVYIYFECMRNSMSLRNQKDAFYEKKPFGKTCFFFSIEMNDFTNWSLFGRFS